MLEGRKVVAMRSLDGGDKWEETHVVKTYRGMTIPNGGSPWIKFTSFDGGVRNMSVAEIVAIK